MKDPMLMKTELLVGMVRRYKQFNVPVPLNIAAALIDRGVDIEAIEPWKSIPRDHYAD